jgi:hypothetical protein
MTADSRLFVGGLPVARISASVSRQLSLDPITVPWLSKTETVGSGNAFAIPAPARDGPIARINTSLEQGCLQLQKRAEQFGRFNYVVLAIPSCFSDPALTATTDTAAIPPSS